MITITGIGDHLRLEWPITITGMIEGSARSRVGAQSTGQYRNAGLHRSLIERSRGSRVVAYGDWTLPMVGAKQRYRFVAGIGELANGMLGWPRDVD